MSSSLKASRRPALDKKRAPKYTKGLLDVARPVPLPEHALSPKNAGGRGLPSPGGGHMASHLTSAGSVQALPTKPSFKLVVVGPAVGGGVKSFDSPVVQDLLDLVQQRHQVRIECGVPFPNVLTITGPSRLSLRAALADIGSMEHSASSKGHKQLFVVQASSELQKKAVLAAGAANPGCERFALADELCVEAYEHASLLPLAAVFSSKLAELTDVLTAVPSNLTLRVHLGRVTTSLGKKAGPSTIHPAVCLGGITNGTDIDTKVVFDRKIGHGKLFDACRDKVIGAKHEFFPCSAISESLDDVQSTKSLVIITEAFHIELDIGPPKATSRIARLSRPRVFQLVGADGRADLIVACPSYCLDWKLEALPQIDSDDVPSTVNDMPEAITVTYYKPDDDFPVPHIPVAMFDTHRIKHVYGKTSWTVGCRGSRYLLELCRFHKFPRTGKGEDYHVSTGISISCASWEDSLRAPAAKGVCRDLDASWSQIFRPRRTRDGVADFLHYMQGMLTLWDGVLESVGAAATPDAHRQADVLPKTVPNRHVSRPTAEVLQDDQGGHDDQDSVPKQAEEDDLILFD